MNIVLKEFNDFLDELFWDFGDGRVRDNIIRTTNIRFENKSNWDYAIYYAYRRKLSNASAEEDEIVECRLLMGSALFHNKQDQKRIIEEMREENSKIRARLKVINQIQLRNGIIKSNVALSYEK